MKKLCADDITISDPPKRSPGKISRKKRTAETFSFEETVRILKHNMFIHEKDTKCNCSELCHYYDTTMNHDGKKEIIKCHRPWPNGSIVIRKVDFYPICIEHKCVLEEL